jgi:hypothetical protein
MPSITYWSRLEPQPRSRALSDSLAARIRDPLWLLARQWQLGEFAAEDAGSPAFAELAARVGRLQSWSAAGVERPLDARRPLDPAVLAEAPEPDDLLLVAELGSAFERALTAASRDDLIESYRSEYPIGRASEMQRRADPSAAALADVLAGRRVHGLALWNAAAAAAPDLPAPAPPDAAAESAVRAALGQLRSLAEDLGVGAVEGDAPAWRPEALDYAFETTGRLPNGRSVALDGRIHREAAVAWHSFDVRSVAGEATADLERRESAVIPTNASFRGMPCSRFWTFDNATFNIAAVRPETRELGKLLVLDFLLVHGVDWYIVPRPQPLGTLADLESLVVQDVFGGRTPVAPAQAPSPRHPRWTLFSLSRDDGSEPSPELLLSPAAGAAAQRGEPLEQVRFARDEMANVAWAIERTVLSASGRPEPGLERAVGQVVAPPPPDSEPGPAGLRYRIQTGVPANWFPLIPVAVHPSEREVQLERGVLLHSAGEEPFPTPVGRILRPTSLGDEPYRLDEEIVPRVGLLASRRVYRTRWVDGSTHVWTARDIRRGSGEETSGLRFDVLER